MKSALKLLVTGGVGFIGSALVRYLNNDTTNEVVNLGKPTYSRHPEPLGGVEHSPRCCFEHADNCDSERAVDWPCVLGFADKGASGRRVGMSLMQMVWRSFHVC